MIRESLVFTASMREDIAGSMTVDFVTDVGSLKFGQRAFDKVYLETYKNAAKRVNVIYS